MNIPRVPSENPPGVPPAYPSAVSLENPPEVPSGSPSGVPIGYLPIVICGIPPGVPCENSSEFPSGNLARGLSSNRSGLVYGDSLGFIVRIP